MVTNILFSNLYLLVCGEEFRPHLSVLLHLAFLGFDYHTLPVYDHCRCLLLNLVQALVIHRFQVEGAAFYFLEIRLI